MESLTAPTPATIVMIAATDAIGTSLANFFADNLSVTPSDRRLGIRLNEQLDQGPVGGSA